MSRIYLAISAVLVTGSAAAGEPRQLRQDDARERGLVDLRRDLGLLMPVGRVVSGDGHSWLTHGDGGWRLVELPSGPGAFEDSPPEKLSSSTTLLFEGTPGAALVFEGPNVAIARFDRDAARIRWHRVFPQPEFSTRPLLSLSKKLKRPADFDKPIGTTDRLVELAGHPAGLTLRATPYGVEVRRGQPQDDKQPAIAGADSIIFSTGGRDGDLGLPPTRGCSGRFKLEIRQDAGADETTVLRVERSMYVEGACDDYPDNDYSETTFVELSPKRPDGRVVFSELTRVDDEFRDYLRQERVVDIPGATLHYEGVRQDFWGYGAPLEVKWTLTPDDARQPIALLGD